MDINEMHRELIQAQNILSSNAALTKGKIDARMRATTKDLLRHIYPLKPEPIEVYEKRGMKMLHHEVLERFTDGLLKVDTSEKRRDAWRKEEWHRTRPLRIYIYVQKLADIFPPEHLTHLIRTSLKHTPEETITIYELNKGEAKQSDYTGEPTGIDLTQFTQEPEQTLQKTSI